MTDIEKALHEIATMAQMMENIQQECEKRDEECSITDAELDAINSAYDTIRKLAISYEYDGYTG